MAPFASSAIDCVGPAFERVKWLLIKPFRWAVWWRLAVIALAIGGSGFNAIVRIPDLANATRRGRQDFSPWSDITHQPHFLALAVLLAFLVVLLIFVHLYISSVLRFVLFDAVATGRYHIREGWKKSNARGLQLFVLQLVIGLVSFAILAVLFGLPIVYGITSGWFTSIDQHPGQFAVLLLLALPVLLIMMVVAYVVMSMVFDFTIPILALETTGWNEAFGRVWRMMKAAKGSYTGYLGMKLVVTIALGLCIGIVNAMVFVLLLIPMVVIGVAVTAASPDIWHNPAGIAAMVTVFAVFLVILMFVGGLFEVPLVTFVQSYALTFFAGRYPPLWALLYPAPPEPPPAPLAPEIAPQPAI